MNFIVNTGLFCIIKVWQEQDISYPVSQIFRNRGVKVQDDTKHIEDTTATEDSLTDVTITNVLTDNLYNDLGFIANNKLMILVEAQST